MLKINQPTVTAGIHVNRHHSEYILPIVAECHSWELDSKEIAGVFLFATGSIPVAAL